MLGGFVGCYYYCFSSDSGDINVHAESADRGARDTVIIELIQSCSNFSKSSMRIEAELGIDPFSLRY
jgi:hypothetical protein